MPLPVRSLPVIQNWDCHACGDCCRTYHVRVTAEERKRIEAQGWEADPALAGVEYFARTGSWRRGYEYRLNHRPDGACVFLGADNLCRIHGKFGSAAKPLACRVYPFALVPAGDHWRVGMRFACPSVAGNKGRPLTEQADDARAYAAQLEADAATGVATDPPPLQPGQAVEWADLLRFNKAVLELLADPAAPVERRLRKVLALADVCKQATFEKVTGPRLKEFLKVVSGSVADDVPADPAAVPRPGWVGRMVFRQVVALYARKDNGANTGTAQRTALGRVLSATRFARGRGRVPKVHGLIPDAATFEAGEQPAGPLPAEAEDLFDRYYRVKVDSLQFCGASNFNLPYWAGLESLVLTFPAVLWLARVLAADGRPRAAAVSLALQVVDDNFGFNTVFGTTRQKRALRLLAAKGELPRLVAWYGR